MRWTFDRIPRLEALISRTLGQAEYLRRAMLDVPPSSEARRLAAARLDLVEKRLRRLRLLARVARHNARVAA